MFEQQIFIAQIETYYSYTQTISSMNINLRGKNALVCGGSKGIGKAAAIQLAALGANVTLVSRSAEIMVDVIRQLPNGPDQNHDFLVADFTNSSDLRRKVTGLLSRKAIHILVNNTGGPAAGPVLVAEQASFEQAFHNHLICNHLLAQMVVKGMKQENYGRIINIISTSVKQPLDGLGVSNTVRGAVASWAKTMANELAPFGITVNNVLPGATYTDRLQSLIASVAERRAVSEAEVTADMKHEIPMGRFADPEEIGAAVAFLASPAAAYITGINLPVDGGRLKTL